MHGKIIRILYRSVIKQSSKIKINPNILFRSFPVGSKLFFVILLLLPCVVLKAPDVPDNLLNLGQHGCVVFENIVH